MQSVNVAPKKGGKRRRAAEKKYPAAKDKLDFVPATQMSPWLDDYDKKKASILQGAKLDAVEGQIKSWNYEAPHDKIIIFVQWKLYATMIGRMLNKNKIGFLYYAVNRPHPVFCLR